MEVISVFCVWLALLISAADSENCPDVYKFSIQPPTELNCNPVGNYIVLQCATVSTASVVTWYWTRNVCEAGVDGTAILIGDNSDSYAITGFSTGNRQIRFRVNESTIGYYWCEISNAVNVSLRPSTIASVIQPTNMSLPACTNALVMSSHNDNLECAEEDSPTVHSRLLIPSSCVPVTFSTIIPSPLSSMETSLPLTSVATTFPPTPFISQFSSSMSTSAQFTTSTEFLVSSPEFISPASTPPHILSSIPVPPTSIPSVPPSSTITATSTALTVPLLSFTSQTNTPSRTQQPTPTSPTSTQDRTTTTTLDTPHFTAALTPSVTPSESSSTTSQTSPEHIVLVSLIAVCVVLALVAGLIVLAIIVLCVLTRKGKSKHSAAYRESNPAVGVDSIAFRELGSEQQQSQKRVNGHSILHSTPSPPNGPQYSIPSVSAKPSVGGPNSAVIVSNQQGNFPAKQPQGVRSFSNPVYEIAPEELRPPSSQPPISLSPQPSAGKGEAGSTLPIYAQPDMSKKQLHQQGSAVDPYSKLASLTTTSPIPAASLNSEPAYSHPDLPAVSQTQKPGIFDADYDEIASNTKLEHRNKQPASQANMAVSYDNVASDIIPKPSHQCTPHPFSHETPSPSVNVHLVTHDEPLESRTRGESVRNNTRNPALFDDPSYATPSPSPHSSDNGNKTGQFQFSGHYEVDPHFQ